MVPDRVRRRASGASPFARCGGRSPRQWHLLVAFGRRSVRMGYPGRIGALDTTFVLKLVPVAVGKAGIVGADHISQDITEKAGALDGYQEFAPLGDDCLGDPELEQR